MESLSNVFITHMFAFFLGLVISKSHKQSGQYTKPILSRLSQVRSAFAEYFTFESTRAARASKYLDSVKVELLDR